jgi:hypothetical protein
MLFEYEDIQRVRMAQDKYVRQEGYQEAEAKYQGLLAAKDEALTAKDERNRQLEEENRRLRGE